MAPDLRFREEVKARAFDDMSSIVQLVCPKEHGGPKDPLEGGDESAVFLAALHYTERSEHLRRAPEPYDLAVLLNRHRGQEDWYQPVLTIGQPHSRRRHRLNSQARE